MFFLCCETLLSKIQASTQNIIIHIYTVYIHRLYQSMSKSFPDGANMIHVTYIDRTALPMSCRFPCQVFPFSWKLTSDRMLKTSSSSGRHWVCAAEVSRLFRALFAESKCWKMFKIVSDCEYLRMFASPLVALDDISRLGGHSPQED